MIQLTLLSEDGRSTAARILDASVGGVRLDAPFLLKPGSLVKVEWKDTLLLGEVLYAQASGSSNILGVELTRALYGMSELRRLNSSLTGATQVVGSRQSDADAVREPVVAGS